MKISPLRLAVPTTLMLIGPALCVAQTPSFRDLALHVNLGDRVRVEEPAGAATRGRIVGLTATEITLQTPSGQRRFGVEVSSIALERHPTRKAILIGAGLGVASGVLAGCTGADRSECGDAGLMLGAVGAGAGALVSALHPSWSAVYPSALAIAAPPSEPWGPLDDIALHANAGDSILVRRSSGVAVRGRLTRLSAGSLVLETESGEARIAAADVRSVAVRRYALLPGALIGAASFTALAVAAPACRDNPDCLPLAAAPLGAGVGAAIGALVPRMKTVYRAEDAHLTLAPSMVRRGVGVSGTIRW